MSEDGIAQNNLRSAFEYARSSFKTENYTGSWLTAIADQKTEMRVRDGLIESAREKYDVLRGITSESLQGDEKEKSQPRVSVVVPVYSREDPKKVLTLIGSLLDSKDAPPSEIITVFNGSESVGDLKNHDLPKLLNQIGIKTAFVTNSSTEKNRNIFNARQSGLDLSEGNQILNVDVDCQVSSAWIKNLSEQLTKTPFAYGPVNLRKESDLWIEKPLIAVSVIAKAGRILAGIPPYYGGSHAFDKEKVLAITSRPYDLIQRNELELPHRLSEIVEKNLQVGYVDKAGIITPFGKVQGRTSSFQFAVRYFQETVSRNLRHLRYKKGVNTKLSQILR